VVTLRSRGYDAHAFVSSMLSRIGNDPSVTAWIR
jgi:hypothetical protein